MNIRDNRREFLILTAIGVFTLYIFTAGIAGHIMTSNYNFSGKIEKIEYPDSLKHIPTIIVRGKKYDLIYCHYNEEPAVGDSVIKKKGQMDLLIIKNKNSN